MESITVSVRHDGKRVLVDVS